MVERRRVIALAVSGVIASCAPHKTEVKQTTTRMLPAFAKSFIPAASGSGNFEICLSNEAEDSGLHEIVLPKGLIFQSFGRLTGDLRNPDSYDHETTSGLAVQPDGVKYAVILLHPVTLSTRASCSKTKVKAVTNDDFPFTHAAITDATHLNFQASGLYKGDSGNIENDLKEPLLSATIGGFLFGTTVADVADSEQIPSA